MLSFPKIDSISSDVIKILSHIQKQTVPICIIDLQLRPLEASRGTLERGDGGKAVEPQL